MEMKAPSAGWTSLLAQTNCAAVVGGAGVQQAHGAQYDDNRSAQQGVNYAGAVFRGDGRHGAEDAGADYAADTHEYGPYEANLFLFHVFHLSGSFQRV